MKNKFVYAKLTIKITAEKDRLILSGGKIINYKKTNHAFSRWHRKLKLVTVQIS